MALSRDQILKSRPRTVSVPVPEWGGDVLLKPLTVGGLAKFMEAREKLSSTDSFTLLVGLSACDEAGSLIFDPDDTAMLSGLAFDVVKQLADEVLKLNKIGDKDAPKN
jgi:hypothetical protein